MMSNESKTVTLYRAVIRHGTNGLTIRSDEFIETAKQFKSAGDSHPYLIPKDRIGEPGHGYARTPEAAVVELKLSLESKLDGLRDQMAQMQAELQIIRDYAGKKIKVQL